MSIIKRIRIQESINYWNDKNPIKIKKTERTVGKAIGTSGRSLSIQNHGKVPKQIQCLLDISILLDCNFDDLFDIEYNPKSDQVVLKRIALQEAIDEWNKTRRKMSIHRVSFLLKYSVISLRDWNKGNVPFPIINFFNLCKNVEKKPSELLEI